ncbi:GumC family protein [Aurantiacibacter poecillastricola]|uniref:GumC family protein n=1 Tax=Aurantiacibacter poecillastricola TaxID=3064385 RepID=UPI00273F95EF|nr:hypothetical protein [Aurantiacibacter sp. 219JJ12-13]MDP5261851.1 hypothetical protein [Aurantiacibacter sp. 219JJ12-13]
MTGRYDDADYLSNQPRRVRTRPAWLRIGMPIAGIVLLTGGIAAAIGLTTTRLYESHVELELITPEGLGEDVTIPLPAERIVAARSSEVATHVVSNLSLLDDVRFLSLYPELDTGERADNELRQRAAGILTANMRTELEDGGSFAIIAYRSADPALAANIADGLAAAFLPVDADRLAEAGSETQAELESLLVEIRGELEAAERALAEGMGEADIVALPDTEAELVTLEGSDAFSAEARQALQSQLALVRARLSGVEAAIASGGLDTEDPVIAQLQDSREDLQAEYDRLTAQFRSDYPAALELRERLDVINATLEREALRQTEERSAQVQRLRLQESDLVAQINALGDEVEARGEAGESLGPLQQDVRAKRELYDLLLARLAAAEGGELPTSARVIAPAEIPTRPVVPDWRLLLGGAAGIALLLSILVVVRDRRRARLAY